MLLLQKNARVVVLLLDLLEVEDELVDPAEVELKLGSGAGQFGQVLQDGWVCGAQVEQAEDAQHGEVGVLAPVRVQ